MVCLGNICRSPLAEGILRHKLTENFSVDSAGTAGYHIGAAPDKRSIAIAKKHGIDISNLKARQFCTEDFYEFDRIYCMDENNFRNVLQLLPPDIPHHKVRLILHENPHEKTQEVPDPYYGDERDFEKVYQLLDNTCEIIAQQLLKH